MPSTTQSPYLSSPHRLADVLAAIQVFGTHRYASRSLLDWSQILGERPQSARTWQEVLSAHPEFFGSSEQDDGQNFYFLRLRRSMQRTVDPETQHEYTPAEIKQLKQTGQYDDLRLVRRTLGSGQIEALMKTAIELQIRAAALEDRSRWWPVLTPAILGLVGVLVGSLLRGR
jgi:hypothetical protein